MIQTTLNLSVLICFLGFTTNFVECLLQKNNEIKICQTSVCYKTASSIMINMDKNVDPCEDFYQFACGNYTRNAVIPQDKGRVNLVTQLNDIVESQLKDIIENGTDNDEPEFVQKVSTYYAACMNEEQLDQNSQNEFTNVLNNIGSWPVLVGESWNDSDFDWEKTATRFRDSGFSSYNTIVKAYFETDMKNNTRNILYIDETTPGLPRHLLISGFNNEVVEKYYELMVNISVTLGANRDRAMHDMRESLNFEIELAKIILPPSEKRNPSKLYNLMLIADLERDFPQIPWLSYLNRLYSTHATFYPSDQIIVYVPNFFNNYTKLLTSTPKRTLANYMYWRIAFESVGSLGKNIRYFVEELSKLIYGYKITPKRWKTCIRKVNADLNLATGTLYVRRFFDEKAKDNAVTMAENIRKSFRQTLIRASWMDYETTDTALKKLNNMIFLIGYPDEQLNDTKLNEYYKNLNLHRNSYLKSKLNIGLFRSDKILKKIRIPISKTDWTDIFGHAAVVNAFYYGQLNVIVLPAGILQAGFFNDQNPKYVNYAGIGSVVSHEIIHGFDDKGRQRNADGELKNWWNDEVFIRYTERSQCTIDQYNNNVVKEVDLHVNGKLTLGENIADIAGLKHAYLAYKKWQEENGEEKRLPGLEMFTPQQMFWITNANVYCSKYTPETLASMVHASPHAPNEFRVKGPVSNIPEFAQDFKCGIGKPMNPENKCAVW